MFEKKRIDWLQLFGGIVLIMMGMTAVFLRSISLDNLTLMICAALLFTGLIQIASFFLKRSSERFSGWGMGLGILDILLAILLYMNLSVAAKGMICLILGFWLLFKGVAGLVLAIELKKVRSYNWAGMILSALACVGLAFSTIAGYWIDELLLIHQLGLLLPAGGIAMIVFAFSNPKFLRF